jgi:hypothetical protein
MSEHDVPSAHEWETALEQLEVQLNRAERMGTTVDAHDLELALPASLSTIPRYLLDRAQSLVERQQQLASTLPDRVEPPIEAILPGRVERPIAGGTLHDRVGHLITGPREPVTFDLFEPVQAEPEPTAD